MLPYNSTVCENSAIFKCLDVGIGRQDRLKIY